MDKVIGGIRTWARVQLSPHNRIKELQQQIHVVQTVHSSTQDARTESELLEQYDKAERDLEEYWRQRSRTQWNFEGDRNTAFFHTIATTQRRMNLISRIQKSDGNFTTNEAEIRRTFVLFYKALYCEGQEIDTSQTEAFFQNFRETDMKKIADDRHEELTRVPTEEEIKRILFQMGPDKAPGPDKALGPNGITAHFLQNNWILLGRELTKAVQIVFTTANPPPQWLKSHIILIPKCDEPLTPKDYRPITIGNIVYRQLMKLVAN